MFANGGYRVTPYLIAKIIDADGNVLSEAKPAVAGEDAERAIDPRNAFIMTSLLHDVVAYGTGARARSSSAATSPARPARPTRTSTPGSAASTRRRSASRGSASTSRRPSGTAETGARGGAADLDVVHAARLKGVPQDVPAPPAGVVSVPINPDTGLRDDSTTLSDWFMTEFPPRRSQDALAPATVPGAAPGPAQDVRDQLF